MTMSIRSIRRRSRASIALAVVGLLLAGLGLMGAGLLGMTGASGPDGILVPFGSTAPAGEQGGADRAMLALEHGLEALRLLPGALDR